MLLRFIKNFNLYMNIIKLDAIESTNDYLKNAGFNNTVEIHNIINTKEKVSVVING